MRSRQSLAIRSSHDPPLPSSRSVVFTVLGAAVVASGFLFLAVTAHAGEDAHAGETVVVETVLAHDGTVVGDDLMIGPDGRIYSSNLSSRVTAVTDDGSAELYASGLNGALDKFFAPDGSLFVSGWTGGELLRVAPGGGAHWLYASMPGAPVGLLPMPGDTHMLVADFDGTAIYRVSMSDSTDVSLFLDDPELVGIVPLEYDADGSIIASSFTTGKVFRIAADGSSFALIADIPPPGGIGYHAIAGDAIYATAFAQHRIYRIGFDGSHEVIAGTGTEGDADGPGATAEFDNPNGLCATASGDTLYVGEFGSRSLRRIILSDDVVGVADLPTVLLVGDAHPNPLRTGTRLPFSLAAPSRVTVTVYDVAGHAVRHLLDAHLAPGSHQVGWDGRDARGRPVPPGVYAYRIEAGPRTHAGRIVRVR